MSELVAFLLARIEHDESIARMAGHGCGAIFHEHSGGWVEVDLPAEHNARPYYELLFIRHNDPARVLAECAAKRRIVEEHPPTDPYNHEGARYCRRCLAHGYDVGYPDEWGQASYPCPTLRLLALPFAGHPDYREEWKP